MASCTILFILGTVMTVHAAEEVRDPPHIMESGQMHKKYFKEGDTFTLSCNATGTPSPTYTWRRGRVTLQKDQKNGSLRITSAGPSHSGDYQCMARNRWGTSISQLIKMEKAYFSRDTSGVAEIYNVSSGIGESLKLVLDPITSIPAATYKWQTVKRLNDEYPVKLDLSRRIQQDLEGNLYFTHLEKGDTLRGKGMYKVEAFNSIEDTSFGSSYHQVSIDTVNPATDHKPYLLYPNTTETHVTFLEGDEFRIQCIFGGRPDVSVEWEGKELNFTSDTVHNTLSAPNVTPSYNGKYYCHGNNSQGSEYATITVDIETIPKFAENGRPESLKWAFSGDPATFRCESSADTKPAASLKWMFNGDDFLEDEKVKVSENGTELTLADLKRDHTGVIQCQLSNKHKTVFAEAALVVYDRTSVAVSPKSHFLANDTQNVTFSCNCTTDVSTEATITWEHDGKPIDNQDDAVQAEAGTLIIHLNGSSDGGKYIGQYTCLCIASNGLSNASDIVHLRPEGISTNLPTVTTVTTVTTQHEGNLTNVSALVGASLSPMVVTGIAGAAIFLILISGCIFLVFNKQKKGTYLVYKRECKFGLSPHTDLQNMSFVEHKGKNKASSKRLLCDVNSSVGSVRSGSQGTMKKSSLHGQENEAADSLHEYEDLQVGNFNEDGSFIGTYSKSP